MNLQTHFLTAIKGAMSLSVGCTEPAAIALNTATARLHARGQLRSIAVFVDPCLYKNALNVGIPGTHVRGIEMCAALGAVAGDASAGMQVLGKVKPDDAALAGEMQDKVDVQIEHCRKTLYIRSVLVTDTDAVQVITYGRHDNIISVSHTPFEQGAEPEEYLYNTDIQRYGLEDFLEFCDTVPIQELAFLREAVAVNNAVADKGLTFGMGMQMQQMPGDPENRSLAEYAKLRTGAASYARMSGLPLPVMAVTGSGNQGITLILTVVSVAQRSDVPEEKLLRALALAMLVNLYSKSFIGNLSAACAVGIAAGLGGGVSVCYMLGGTKEQMLATIRNILGSITGMICDGAKEGCANKVGLSAALAVDAALMSLAGGAIDEQDGILGDDFRSLFSHLGDVVQCGMGQMNDVIIRIMRQKKQQEAKCPPLGA